MSFLLGVGATVVIGVTSPIWGGFIKDRLKSSSKEATIVVKQKRFDEFYDKSDLLIEAYILSTQGLRHGTILKFETALRLIEQRNDWWQANAKEKKYDMDCPICSRNNYRYINSGVTFNCICPERNKIRAFLENVERSR